MVSDVNSFAQKWSKSFAAKKFFTGFYSLLCSLNLNIFWPPLPKVQCQHFFLFSESLGKTNGKKWSQISILLLIKGVKLPRKKKVRFSTNFVLLAGVFGFSSTICIGQEMLCLSYVGFFCLRLSP